MWLLPRKLRGRGSFIAAPRAMAAVIGAWAGLAAIGWALLYLPHLTDGFIYGAGVPLRADFAEALYISLVTLSTVGSATSWQRIRCSGWLLPSRRSPASGC
ncbi:hypothetical protein JOE31_003594 [Arthrobacter sp. PvP023]|uniref:hypothetical protein n=1 Tax=Micrococcaceae TaxID=1268 RepID=UPI001B6D4A6A|nr:hypothetical protein [Arthrobacter sp. PvP023]MBP1137362.1 hypothetical protein [Arthrobacter sp. PvP023]